MAELTPEQALAAKKKYLDIIEKIAREIDTYSELSALTGIPEATLEDIKNKNRLRGVVDKVTLIFIKFGKGFLTKADVVNFSSQIVSQSLRGNRSSEFRLREGIESIKVKPFGLITQETITDTIVARLLFADHEKYSKVFEPIKVIGTEPIESENNDDEIGRMNLRKEVPVSLKEKKAEEKKEQTKRVPEEGDKDKR